MDNSVAEGDQKVLQRFIGRYLARPFAVASLEHLDAFVYSALDAMRAEDGLAATTLRGRRQAYTLFRRFLKETRNERGLIGGDPHLQVRILKQFIANERNRGKARASINSVWRALRSVFEAQRASNPFRLVQTPHAGEARMACLTPDAAARILVFVQNDACVEPRLRARNAAIVGTMLLAGLRKREALSIRVEDVDLKERTILVRKGKGRNGGRSRTIPMTDQLQVILERYGSVRASVKSTAPELFLGVRGRPLSDCVLRRLFRTISERTNVFVTPHMLRHTFCTLLSRFGISDRLARQAMGHADLRTLQRYQHVYPGELAQSLHRLVLELD
jgi:site-specific recombinase XerD